MNEFDDFIFQKFMKDGMLEELALSYIDILKVDFPEDYKEIQDEWFDEIHPY